MRNILQQCGDYWSVYIGSRGRWSSDGNLSGNVRISYGFESLPGAGVSVGGGIIKLLDLAKMFPHHTHRANILYLVSSSLPRAVLPLVRQARRAGVKIVINQNGVAYKAWHGAGWAQVNRPLSMLLKMADYVFYQSQFCKDAADIFLGPHDGRHEVLFNAVDTSVFVPRMERRVSDLKTFLLAGTHCQYYRVLSALKTLALLRDQGVPVRLIIAGRLAWESDSAAALKTTEVEIRRLKLESLVEIVGPYSQNNAVDLFQGADILLHTQYNDSCPRLVLEAMSCGLPVVCSASGGVPELIGTDSGIGVPTVLDWENVHLPEPTDFATAALEVIKNYSAFAKAARERAVRLFGLEPWLMRHKVVCESLVA